MLEERKRQSYTAPWAAVQTAQYRFSARKASNSHSLAYRGYLSLDLTAHCQPSLPGCIGVSCRQGYPVNARDELLKQTFLKQIKPKHMTSMRNLISTRKLLLCIKLESALNKMASLWHKNNSFAAFLAKHAHLQNINSVSKVMRWQPCSYETFCFLLGNAWIHTWVKKQKAALWFWKVCIPTILSHICNTFQQGHV